MKKLRLLHPLLVSALHTFLAKHLLPPAHNATPFAMPRLLAPYLHPQSSTNDHKGTNGTQLPLLSAPALGFFQSNSPASCFRPACKPCPQACLSFPGFLWGAGEEAYFISLFYRVGSCRARRGIHSSKYGGEGGGRLPPPFVVRSCGHCV